MILRRFSQLYRIGGVLKKEGAQREAIPKPLIEI